LFIGFSFFHAPNTIQGLQNQMYAVMMLLSMYGQLSEQIMPQFISQREVYEERERPSKIYDWKGTNSGQDIYGRADFIGSADPEQPHD
jgi:ABC-type multidrug transport system permease subunit